MIENGATTIWERWDGYVKGRGFQMPGMNSFNHYAFGAVDEWMWRNIVGINPDEQHPGFKHFVVHPELSGDLTWARGSYNSIRGPIRSSWKLDGKKFSLHISVPPNTSATVYLPATEMAQVSEGGRPVSSSPTLPAKDAGKGGAPTALGVKNGAAAFEVASGDYEFTVDNVASRTVTAGR